MAPQQNSSSTSKQCTPNILPCHIHHSGPLKISKRHWTPKSEANGTQTAYFRGRKLRGRKVKLPKGYEGQFVRSIEKILPPSTSADPDPAPSLDEDEAPAEPESVKVLEGNSTFAHLVVWGHDALPAGNDPFVKGVEEWVAFAEMVDKFVSEIGG